MPETVKMALSGCCQTVTNVADSREKGGCKKFCVYGEIIFTDRNQICKNLLSNSITFMLSNSFSDNSIANPLSFIHDLWFFCMPIRH